MMSNEEFLKRLEAALTGRVPQEDVDDAMCYHREYFAEAGENAANEIPAPEEVAAQIIRDREAYLRKRQLHWAKPAIVAAICVAVVVTIGMLGGRMLLGRLIGWNTRDAIPTARPDISAIDQVTVVEDWGTAEVLAGTEHGFHHYQEGDRVYTDLEVGTVFESIVIEGVSDNVTITRGTDFSLGLWHDRRENVDCQVRDGVLCITGSVKGTLSAGFQPGEISITIPEVAGFYRIQVETDLGDIYMDGVSVGEVELDTDLGDISVSGGTFDLLDCDSDMGDVSVSSVEAARLKCECDCGNIEVIEFDATETELVADLGSVTAIATGSIRDYDLELAVDLGEIKVNGERKKSGSYAQSVGADRSLHAKADTGSITLDFMQD